MEYEFATIRHALEEHLSSINENTSEIQSLFDYLQEMEQKVEKVVSEAAAKLKQSTKNAIDTEKNKLDLKTTNEIENITKKLQKEIRTKIHENQRI